MLHHLLIHRVLPKASITRTTYPLERFEKLLYSIQNKVVIPGDKIPILTKSYALTFDDATFDFYHYIFPLLKLYNVRACLAIPTSFILPECNLSFEKRVQSIPFKQKEAHCSWEEIEEMVSSNLVIPLSHSHHHLPLTHQNIKEELLCSKKILEKQLGIKVDGIVFPYGKASKKTFTLSKKYYTHRFRIGSALNLSWSNLTGIGYRIPIENYNKRKKVKYLVKWLASSLSRR